MVNAALDDIIHSTGTEDLLIHMLKVGFADGKLVCHAGNVPVKIWHVVNLSTDKRHSFIIGANSLIRMCTQFFA